MKKNSEKPVFPRWLRRLDPTLEAAETNTIFRAFRVRRTDHIEAGPLAFLRLWWKQQNIRRIIWYILGVILIIIFWKYLNCCGLFLAFGIIGMFTNIMRRTKLKHGKLPFWVSDVFSPIGVVEPVAIDLWTTGIKGRDIIEAIHLETRLREWVKITISYILLILTICTLYLLFREMCVITLVTLISALCLSRTYFTHIHVFRSNKLCTIKLNLIVQGWGNTTGKLQLRDSFNRGIDIGSPTIFALFFAFLGILPILIAGTLARTMNITPYYSPFRIWAIDPTYFVDLVCAVVYLLFAYKFTRQINSDENKHKAYDNLLERSDFAFDSFMCHTIVQDPDGITWAQWYHQMTYHKKEFYWVKGQFRDYYWVNSPDGEHYLCASENYSRDASSEIWNRWQDFPISNLLMREVESFTRWHQQLGVQPPETRDHQEVEQFHQTELALVTKLQRHLGPNYRIVFNRSVLH